MRHVPDVPNERQRRLIMETGESLLKMFHSLYEKEPLGVETEYHRGQFTNWKRMLLMLYNEDAAEKMIYGVSEQTRLSVPPGGPLADDGSGDYVGWDSYCHSGYIGKLQ
jgi:hypothetical protein